MESTNYYTGTDSTSERLGQTVRDATNNPAQTARNISAPLERNLAQEPANSTVRSLLLMAAGASIIGSLVMQIQGRKHEALFVGQWAPTLLTAALWYQVVKARTYYSGVNEQDAGYQRSSGY